MSEAATKANSETDATGLGQRMVTVIEPPRGWARIDFPELWRYRELFAFLVWRDVKVKYKQTMLGFAWAIIAPVAMTVIFTFIFGRLAGMSTDGLPGPVYYMSGLVIWRYFQNSLNKCSESLVAGQALLTKIYLPRLILPISTTISELVDFSISCLILLGIMLYFQTLPALTTLFLPALVLMAMITALGVGLFFAALNVRFRDVRQLIPFVSQMWMYCSVIIPFSQIAGSKRADWKYLYGLNPMGGVVEGFRWCLAHHKMPEGTEPPWMLLAIGLPVALAMLTFGLYYFRRVESQFADIV